MEKILKKLWIAVLALTTLAFVACNTKPDPTPEPKPEPKPEPPIEYNQHFVFDGQAAPIKSIVVDPTLINGLTYILFSEEEGLDTFDKMTETQDNKYVHKFISLYVATTKFADCTVSNISTPPAGVTFAIHNLTQYAPDIMLLTQSESSQVSAGSFSTKLVGDNFTLSMSLTSKETGKILNAKFTTKFTAPEPPADPTENFMVLDDEIKAIKAAFYEAEQYKTTLSLTPSFIEDPDNLVNVASYYIKFEVDNYAMGEMYDIAELEEEFTITLGIPKNEEVHIAKYGDLGGAKGMFSIRKGETQGQYSIEFELSIGGHYISGIYEGEFKTSEKPNQYVVNSEAPVTLGSVIFDKSNPALYKIYLCQATGINTVTGMIDANPIILEGEPSMFAVGAVAGFSLDPNNAITFNNMKYSSATEDAGNFENAVTGNMIAVKFQIFDLDNKGFALTGYYKGAFTSIE